MLDSMGGRSGQFSKATLAAVMLAALALTGCPAARRGAPPPLPVPGPSPAEIAPPAAGATRYRVASGESLIVVLVYRGGAFASLGHNHVIASRSLAGVIDVRDPPSASTFELHLPVAEFTVDEPQLRSGRGPDFANAVSDSAREGTRRNMLAEDQLDAVHFPQIVVRAVSFTGGPHSFAARFEVSMRGKRYTLEVPVQVDRPDADRLHITSKFPVSQRALGLTPLSVMLGAIQVEDMLAIEVDLSARRVP